MKVIVIGGGASGLVFAICASRLGNDVTVIEANARVGKKLLLTGAGRCNLTNANVNALAYNNSVFVKKILDFVTFDEYQKFITSCGIFTTQPDEEGRIYPITYSSASVCDCLRFCAMRSGVKILCNSFVEKVCEDKEGFCVVTDGKNLHADKVVVAVGSASQAKNTNLDKLVGGKYLTATVPSLAPMTVKFVAKSLSGVRAKCKVSLKKGDTLLACEQGEVQFRDFGLSGICIFNLCSHVARSRVAGDKSNFDVHVDFLPDFSAEFLKNTLSQRIADGFGEQLFVGLLPNKIAEWLQKQNKYGDLDRYVALIKNFVFEQVQPVDFDQSQVTSGGVDVKFVNDKLALPNGIVVIGEALDVDGLCGGYNLHFAFASAMYASKHIFK